jgi:leucyl aminopeptidase
MTVTVRNEAIERVAAEAVVLGIFEGTKRLSGAARALDRACGGALQAFLDRGDFAGRREEVDVLYPRGRMRAKRVVMVGLGPQKELTLERIRQAAGRAITMARSIGVRELATVVHGVGTGGFDPEDAAQAVVEGSMLANYSFDRYRTRDGQRIPLLRQIAVVEDDDARLAAVRRGAQRGRVLAEAVTATRDLCNTPSLDLTPRRFAEHAAELGSKDSGVSVRVLDEKECKKLGMGSFLGVAKGSDEPPRFVVFEYVPKGTPKATICLVGKGITFDTGGISLKPADGMEKMKYDMSGAAAVLGVFHALRKLKPAVRVIGITPTTENMPGGHAIKPGDVLTAMDGTTLEVTNTDAEGRLILADGVAYATRFKPDAIIDIATLTGAIVIALGGQAAGLFTNDTALGGRLKQSAERTGERLWEMPTWPEYKDLIQSDIADMKNSAGREGSAIQGALFIGHFAGSTPWAHLDIAGTAWNDKPKPYGPKGSTGFGVRLLVDLLTHWE